MLRIEFEYGYDGELIHNIVDDKTDELVAMVFAGQETAEQMIESLDNARALAVLEKM
jgi:hypothetical protein